MSASLTDFERAVALPADTDDGPYCPRCATAIPDRVTDRITVPVDTLVDSPTKRICERAGVETLDSRGRACPNCPTVFPRRVASPAAEGWTGHVGIEVSTHDETVIGVGVAMASLPDALHGPIARGLERLAAGGDA